MATPPSLSIFSLTSYFLFLLLQASNSLDFQPLMAFKTASDTNNKLTTWNSTTHSCTWDSVSCEPCLRNRKAPLHSHGPNLSNLTSIRLIFLSHNNFSSELPSSFMPLTHLYGFNMFRNNLSGDILMTVHDLAEAKLSQNGPLLSRMVRSRGGRGSGSPSRGRGETIERIWPTASARQHRAQQLMQHVQQNDPTPTEDVPQ
ncbi:Leucine-rich repeat-containing N-terminal, plant-type [Sesbania bispinosa]|nr:Leucine-rich repeat-containing N-terminal, plant-type [Sesbania bispinosa]